ncbi:restriction endonuclease subunit S [Bacillus paranthracis]|uniref:restriction endonuclease subunit S n=1 Tax=Bacillus paranthracis TaxID=2026186 RepID=UPI003D65CFDA
MTWKTYTLNDVFKSIKNGLSVKQSKDKEGLPITRIETISLGVINIEKVGYAGLSMNDVSEWLLEDGDILLSHINSLEHIGKVAQYTSDLGNLVHGMNLVCLRADKEVLYPKFALYYFRTSSFRNKLLRLVNQSVNQCSISVTNLKNIAISLPSLKEQKKIVAVLDKAQALIEKRKEAVAKLDELIQAVFLDIFGDPVTNPKKWKEVKVIDVCDCIVPGRDKPKKFEGNIPWITIKDLVAGGNTNSSREGMGLTEDDIEAVKGKIIPKGSVLMSCVGDLGITSIAGTEMIINQQLHSFQCKEKINNYFLCHLLPFKKDYMERVANSTTVLYMNKGKCNSIPIYLPPIHIQEKFAQTIKIVNSQRAIMEDSLKKLEGNFNSLLQKAFKGELKIDTELTA